jgi:deoxyhypusine synthase
MLRVVASAAWNDFAPTIRMTAGEATIAMPLIVGYGYHKGSWKRRGEHRFSDFLRDGALVAARR